MLDFPMGYMRVDISDLDSRLANASVCPVYAQFNCAEAVNFATEDWFPWGRSGRLHIIAAFLGSMN